MLSLGAQIAEMARSDAPALSVADGYVTSTAPLLVAVGADPTGRPATKLGSYTATLGDKVLVLVRGADRCVLGKVG